MDIRGHLESYNELECPRCGVKIPKHGVTNIEPIECPTCGFRFSSDQPSLRKTAAGLVRDYFRNLRIILTQPTLFFQHMPLQGGLVKPLAFALTTHWLGSAIGFLWQHFLGGSLSRFLKTVFQSSSRWGTDIDYSGRYASLLTIKERFMDWILGVGPVLLDPFFTLASIFFAAGLIFIGARILISSKSSQQGFYAITYESAIRITAYGLSPAILSAIPLFGTILAPLYTFILTVIGIREAYRTSTGRAILVALFPKLLIPGIIGAGVLFFILMIAKLIFSSF